jgi:hypothetical protein
VVDEAHSSELATPKVAGPWRVVLQTVGGTEVLPSQRIELLQLPAEAGPVDVALWTRFEEVGLEAGLPQETFFEVVLIADDANAAVAGAGAVAVGLTTMISFCVNAFVSPPEPALAYDVAPDLEKRRFWQRRVAHTYVDFLRPTRRIRFELLAPFLGAVFASPDGDRIGRAVSQYQIALRYWTTGGQALALAHLYMALEALGPVAQGRERDELGLKDDKDHAVHRGVDISRSNWHEVLLGWIRRDVLCDGDKETYDAARQASDGFEHGFMSLPDYRALASANAPTLLDHVRRAVLNLLDLDESVRAELADKRPVDTSPLWLEVRGELTGDVGDADQLAETGYKMPHPCAEWEVTLDEARRTEDDGRLRLTPRSNLTAHLAPKVQLTFTYHGIAVGLSDLEMFEVEPTNEEPHVIPRDQQPMD